jgi:hypothetical protein
MHGSHDTLIVDYVPARLANRGPSAKEGGSVKKLGACRVDRMPRSAWCKNQADRAKTQWDARYGRAQSEISHFFLLCARKGREIRAVLDAPRSFRTVCKSYAAGGGAPRITPAPALRFGGRALPTGRDPEIDHGNGPRDGMAAIGRLPPFPRRSF